MPISAEPALVMMVRTSAKSRLIRPGTVIRSEMPLYALAQHVVGDRERVEHRASPCRTTCSRRSLGMTMRVSTFSRSSAMPCSAWAIAPLALEDEGLGDHGDGQRATVSRAMSRDDGRPAGAGAAAHAGGDEHHVRAFEERLGSPRGSLRPPAGRPRDWSPRRGPG